MGLVAASTAGGCLHGEGDADDLPDFSRWMYEDGEPSYSYEYVRPRRIAPVLSGESRFLGVEVVLTSVLVLPDATVESFVPGNIEHVVDGNLTEMEPEEELHGFDVYGGFAVDETRNYHVQSEDSEILRRVLRAYADDLGGRLDSDEDLAEAARLLGESDVVVAGSGAEDVVPDTGAAGGFSMTVADEAVDVTHVTVFESREAVDRERAEIEAEEGLGEMEDVRQIGRSIVVSGSADADVIAPFVTYGI